MVRETDSSYFTKVGTDFSVHDATSLAKRLGDRGYGSFEEVFSIDERSLKFKGIGKVSLGKLNTLSQVLAERAKTSVGMVEHNISYVIYGKSVYYRYGVYDVDGIPISFPSPYNNENIIWLLKGDKRRISTKLPQGQVEKMINDIGRDIAFLSNHFHLGLQFKTVKIDGIDYFSVDVPPKTKVT